MLDFFSKIQRLKPLLGLISLLSGPFTALGQEQQSLSPVDFFLEKYPDLEQCVIQQMEITGNEQTLPFIIYREMAIEKGDTLNLSNLRQTLTVDEQGVKNTRLFTKVRITPHWINRGEARLVISVNERWYSFPKPVFDLADRNFNEWWVERNHKLSRTVYGVIFYQENLSGRNDELQVGTKLGFRENYSLFYTLPFLSSTSRIGIRAGASFGRTKKLPYTIQDNNLVYYLGDDHLQRNMMGELEFSYRQNIFVNHVIRSTFHSQWAGEPIVSRNSAYFGNGSHVQRYFKVGYTYERDYRDLVNYAKSGHLFRASVEKLGLGLYEDVDHTWADITFQQFKPLGGNFYWASELRGHYSLPAFQNFSLERGLGYNDMLVRGYEYNVIDGQNYVLNRNGLRYELFDAELNRLRFIPLEQFNTIPLTMYLKVFADQGYVVDDYEKPVNSLANQYLSGWGAGFDLVTYYDIVFRVEYAFNNQGERDLFLHFVKPF